MKHQTGDWLAKWQCGNILHFHAFSLNYADYDYTVDRRIIAYARCLTVDR